MSTRTALGARAVIFVRRTTSTADADKPLEDRVPAWEARPCSDDEYPHARRRPESSLAKHGLRSRGKQAELSDPIPRSSSPVQPGQGLPDLGPATPARLSSTSSVLGRGRNAVY